MGECIDLTGQKFGLLTVIKKKKALPMEILNGYVNVNVEILL